MEFSYKNPIIYYIGGKARYGKTTSASIIKEYYEQKGKKVVVLQHAKYIKDYARDYFGWDGREETKPRELLQQISTSLIRGTLGKEEFFINRILEDIEILSCFFDCIIVDDVRIKKEFTIPRAKLPRVITIKMIRPGFENGLLDHQKQHLTEIDLDDFNDVDYILVNDQGISELKDKLIDIIHKSDNV